MAKLGLLYMYDHLTAHVSVLIDCCSNVAATQDLSNYPGE